MINGLTSKHIAATWAIILISASLTISCGGGGGGGATPPTSVPGAGELSYSGVTDGAQLSAGNAKRVLDNALGSNQGVLGGIKTRH